MDRGVANSLSPFGLTIKNEKERDISPSGIIPYTYFFIL
jgi:hypothetical protein